MKNLRTIILPLFAIGMVTGIMSCEKEENLVSIHRTDKATLDIRSIFEEDRVGEEEGEEVIQGGLYSSSSVAVNNVEVSLLDSQDSTVVVTKHTDSLGNFIMKPKLGNYYFRVRTGGNNFLFTPEFEFQEDLQITINI